jgi:hypothetical protein
LRGFARQRAADRLAGAKAETNAGQKAIVVSRSSCQKVSSTHPYPTRFLWVNGFNAPHESWPISHSDNGYKIGIGGFVDRNSGKRVVILSGKDEPVYYPAQLPIKTNCDTTVTDPDFPNPSETQIHIDYEITTNR